MNGQRVVATPTVANDPVARKRKSRFVTEGPWPVEAVSELMVMQRVSKRTSGLGESQPRRGMKACAAISPVYPPPASFATTHIAVALVFGLDLAWAFDHDLADIKIDALGDAFAERQKQSLAASGGCDLKNVARAVIDERGHAANARASRVDGLQPDQVVIVEFVMRRRRQLVAAGED